METQKKFYQTIKFYDIEIELKKMVEKYGKQIAENVLSTEEALAAISKEYNHFLEVYYYIFQLLGHVPVRGDHKYMNKDFYLKSDRQPRPEQLLYVDSNARYDIFDYKDSKIAVPKSYPPTAAEVWDNKIIEGENFISYREKIITLWEQYKDIKDVPDYETVTGFMFDKSINITDTASIEEQGFEQTVSIRDLKLKIIKVEYYDLD